jgi:hypothetical protein
MGVPFDPEACAAEEGDEYDMDESLPPSRVDPPKGTESRRSPRDSRADRQASEEKLWEVFTGRGDWIDLVELAATTRTEPIRDDTGDEYSSS